MTKGLRANLSLRVVLAWVILTAFTTRGICFAQIPGRTPSGAGAARKQTSAPQASDDHLALCHKDFLRFYRYKVTHMDPQGRTYSEWGGWHLIVDHPEDSKVEVETDLKWFRERGVEVEFTSLEGKLPK